VWPLDERRCGHREGFAHAAHDTVVVDASRCREHEFVCGVSAPIVVDDLTPTQSVDRLNGAGDDTAQWRSGPVQGSDELIVHHVVGIIVVHRDLFEDDVAFALDLDRGDQ
jgi:hypothetical protein